MAETVSGKPLHQRGHAAHSGGLRVPLPFLYLCSSRFRAASCGSLPGYLLAQGLLWHEGSWSRPPARD